MLCVFGRNPDGAHLTRLADRRQEAPLPRPPDTAQDTSPTFLVNAHELDRTRTTIV
jgi:hypothetical protein